MGLSATPIVIPQRERERESKESSGEARLNKSFVLRDCNQKKLGVPQAHFFRDNSVSSVLLLLLELENRKLLFFLNRMHYYFVRNARYPHFGCQAFLLISSSFLLVIKYYFMI